MIKVGNKFYKPSSNKNLKEIVIGTATFLPVDKSETVTNAINPTKAFKNTYAIKI